MYLIIEAIRGYLVGKITGALLYPPAAKPAVAVVLLAAGIVCFAIGATKSPPDAQLSFGVVLGVRAVAMGSVYFSAGLTD